MRISHGKRRSSWHRHPAVPAHVDDLPGKPKRYGVPPAGSSLTNVMATTWTHSRTSQRGGPGRTALQKDPYGLT
jgi:hypothetical protein